MKKYELIPSDIDGLFRIKALRDFASVKKGDIGGYVASEDNLSHDCNAWVYGDAKVYGNAWVYGNAVVSGSANVYGYVKVSGTAEICGDVNVSGYAHICGNAKVSKRKDYIVFNNWWSSGRYFTWTRSNNMWKVGCFYGTGDELIAKAYADSESKGREYERVVKYVESILQDNNYETE